MAKEIIVIPKRWSWLTALSVEIECDPSAPPRIKLGLAVKAAFDKGADLTGAVLADVDLADVDLTGAVLTGAVLAGAVLAGAVMTDVDLTGAVMTDVDLTGAVMTDVDLTDVDLRDVVLTGAVLTGAVLRDVPKIENIHQTVYAAASSPGALDMTDWHGCDTTHCRAGWVTTLAGAAGRALDDRIGTAAAATLIYLTSDPSLESIPDFYCSNDAALTDMRRLAEQEAARARQPS